MNKKNDPFIKIDKLYDRALLAMGRDMERIVQLGIAVKLEASAARDLREYIKLLADMKEAHEKIKAEKAAQAKAAEKRVSDEELEKVVAGAGLLLPTQQPLNEPAGKQQPHRGKP